MHTCHASHTQPIRTPSVVHPHSILTRSLSLSRVCTDAILGVEFFYNFGVSASRAGAGMPAGADLYDPSTCWHYSLHRPWVHPRVATPWTANRTGDKEILEAVTARGQCFGTEYFGTFFRSWYSLFQVLTTESWAEAIGRRIGFHWPCALPCHSKWAPPYAAMLASY